MIRAGKAGSERECEGRRILGRLAKDKEFRLEGGEPPRFEQQVASTNDIMSATQHDRTSGSDGHPPVSKKREKTRG
jgi:hypothetical protein